MSEAPFMPKATAVWLVENTTLTFKQIAEFCKLHELDKLRSLNASVWLSVCLPISLSLCDCVLICLSPNVALDVACVSMSLSAIVFSMSLSVIVYLSGCLCVSQCFSVSRFCFSMFLCQPVWSYSY